jgi:hypothetical protein
VGEIWVDTTNSRVVVNDGSTPGGWSAPKLVETLTNWRVPVADADRAILATDRFVPYTSLTAARTVTLCAASAYPPGTPLVINDESGNCSAAKSLTIARAGSDTIDGATSTAITSAYGFITLESDGSSKWTIIGQSATPRLILNSVNANSVADSSIVVRLPPGFSRYRVTRITALNPSTSLTAAFAAVYTAATAGGVAIASPQALSGLTNNTANSAGNAIDLTLALAAPVFFTAGTLYFRITIVQGSAATVDVVIEIEPYN